jgi:hypothetical protein
LALTHHVSTDPAQQSLKHRCDLVRGRLVEDGLFDGTAARWRIAPDPFVLSATQLEFFQMLGGHLLAFYRALNRLYQESVHGRQPAWVAAYLDQGKPESLVAYSRMNRFRDLIPAVIRPDVIPIQDGTETGMVITELDSVPGGIGLTGSLGRAYASLDPQGERYRIVGGADGMTKGFAAMLRGQTADEIPSGCTAIVFSEEANDYRPEMTWLAAQLRAAGQETYCLAPDDIRFTESALFAPGEGGERPVSLLYRFFELFDLKNVPKAELIMYSAKKERVAVTPPFKPALEEKLAFALLHHPALASFWSQELGETTFALLSRLMPRTWILDPRPMPPIAVIPDLHIGGRPVSGWQDLKHASQKERRLVIKPSGFSELAWGSRGVSVGHDLSQADWAAAIETALASFPATPYVLQEYHKGRQFELAYADERSGDVIPMPGRARLSPYYFLTGDRVELGGILATVCSLDKKVIHGMRDAIMAPCAAPA